MPPIRYFKLMPSREAHALATLKKRWVSAVWYIDTSSSWMCASVCVCVSRSCEQYEFWEIHPALMIMRLFVDCSDGGIRTEWSCGVSSN